MSNPQWHECFNTKVDVASAIGMTQQHKALLEFVAQEMHSAPTHTALFKDLDDAQQKLVRQDAKERHLACVFMQQSSDQHAPLKKKLINNCCKNSNTCPKMC